MRSMDAQKTPREVSVAAAVELADIGHRYGELVALKGISLSFPTNEVSCIVGPSGCGKSTVLDLISGLQRPTSGKVSQDGVPITGPNPSSAMVFQQPALYPWLTVAKNVMLGLKVRGVGKKEARERSRSMLATVGLEGFENSYPHELSGGMAQRVGVARALVLRPSVLLMDEPFAAVDAYTRLKLQDELRTIISEHKTTVIFVTHDIAEAVLLGDQVAVMSARPGTILQTFQIPEAAKSHTSQEHSKYSEAILKLLSNQA